MTSKEKQQRGAVFGDSVVAHLETICSMLRVRFQFGLTVAGKFEVIATMASGNWIEAHATDDDLETALRRCAATLLERRGK